MSNQPHLNDTEVEWLRLSIDFLKVKGGRCSEEKFRSYIIRLTNMTWNADRLIDYMYEKNLIRKQNNDIISVPFIQEALERLLE